MTTVLWVVPAYPWEAEPVGGVFFRTQAQALQRVGVEIVVACPTPWAPWPISIVTQKWRQYAAVPAIASDGPIQVLRPRYLNVPRQPAWARPDRLVARAVWETRSSWLSIDVVHGHSAMTGLAAWRVARRAGLPLLLTFHGSDLNSWPDAHRDRIADLRAAARDARAVLTVSEPLAERARALTGTDPIALPIGSDHRRLGGATFPRAAARAALGLPEDRLIVLFVGNLVRAKGVRELVDALLAADEAPLGVFVGDGPERGYGPGERGGTDRLDYRGAVPPDEVPRYMSAADVLVLPSHAEGLPSVLVEAGSVGLPVIASGVGGIPSLLGRDRGTLLPETSSAAIGSALQAFGRDRGAAVAGAARLQAFVRKVHDVDTNAAVLAELYRR